MKLCIYYCLDILEVGITYKSLQAENAHLLDVVLSLVVEQNLILEPEIYNAVDRGIIPVDSNTYGFHFKHSRSIWVKRPPCTRLWQY